MLDRNIVEPPDHLYREGNIIGKYLRDQKKSYQKKGKKQALKKKKAHKYQTENLGNLVDVEV